MAKIQKKKNIQICSLTCNVVSIFVVFFFLFVVEVSFVWLFFGNKNEF